jgi:predicted transcriptional regulator
MAVKRPMGGLEEEVMEFLWQTDGSVTPAVVHKAVAPELAYTTVMTILSRLYDKGRLTRGQQGRAYTYEPIRTEAEHRAEEMQATLIDAGDRAAVLSRFVDYLDSQDAKTLRKLLGRST